MNQTQFCCVFLGGDSKICIMNSLYHKNNYMGLGVGFRVLSLGCGQLCFLS
jgi:hypothetical protein